ATAASAMQNDPEVANLRLNYRDGNFTFGNVLLVPIEQSVLYVQSMYVTSTDDVPTIPKVIVAYQVRAELTQVEVGDTLYDALVKLFGTAPATLEDEPDPDLEEDPTAEDPPDEPAEPGDDFDGSNVELIEAIQEEFDLADQALADGDGLAAYQEHIDEAERLLGILAARQEPPDEDEPSGTGPATEGAGGASDEEGNTTTTTTSPPATGEQDRSDPSTTTTSAPPSSSTTVPSSSTTRPSA
ncbi:MAG TPA: hypothetical protein VF228_02440, partial [Iamia sp.]